MRTNARSISGALMMLVIIPVFAGLLACMPVPVGNPERSRIDPDMSGAWVVDQDSGIAMYLLRPYDKRTWLMFGLMPVEGDASELDDFEIDTAGDLIAALRRYPVDSTGIVADDEIIAYKVWLTKLGGELFMTWEPVGGMNSDGSFAPEYWFVWKVVKESADRFELYLLDGEHDAFDDIVKPKDYEGDDYTKKMRRTWERAIKRNIDDETLYSDEAWVFQRVPHDVQDKAASLFNLIIDF